MSPELISDLSIAPSHARAVRQHARPWSEITDAGNSRHRSTARATAFGSGAAALAALASAKNIGHAPIVSTCVTNNENVSDLHIGGQLDVARDDVVFHAQAAEETRLA